MECRARWNESKYRGNQKLPFDVAGKTGITGFPNEQERMINHSLFIAYAPTEDPQIAVSVVIPGSNSEKTL